MNRSKLDLTVGSVLTALYPVYAARIVDFADRYGEFAGTFAKVSPCGGQLPNHPIVQIINRFPASFLLCTCTTQFAWGLKSMSRQARLFDEFSKENFSAYGM